MEEAAENGKESSRIAHANGMNDRYKQSFYFLDNPIYKAYIILNTTNTYFI
jgi:hypothetical protein